MFDHCKATYALIFAELAQEFEHNHLAKTMTSGSNRHSELEQFLLRHYVEEFS